MDRKKMQDTIGAIYDARMRGDVPAMQALMAPNATFRFAGESAMRDGFDTDGAVPFTDAVKALDGVIAMTKVVNRTMLFEDNRVAAIWHCDVQFPGRDTFTTEIFNLWTFDESGKVSDLTEFVDTAKLASETSASKS